MFIKMKKPTLVELAITCKKKAGTFYQGRLEYSSKTYKCVTE
jgi:hypothetical protein